MSRFYVLCALIASASAFVVPTGRVASRPVACAATVARPATVLPRLTNISPIIMAEEASAEAAAAEASSEAAEEKDGIMETLTTGAFFGLWYLFNIGYNIYNKKALNALPIPYTMAALQLFVGIPYVALLWATGLRKAPKLSTDNVKTLIPVSLGHLGTHIGAVRDRSE